MPIMNQWNPYLRQQQGMMQPQQEQDPFASIANILASFQNSTPNSQERTSDMAPPGQPGMNQTPSLDKPSDVPPAGQIGNGYSPPMGDIMTRVQNILSNFNAHPGDKTDAQMEQWRTENQQKARNAGYTLDENGYADVEAQDRARQAPSFSPSGGGQSFQPPAPKPFDSNPYGAKWDDQGRNSMANPKQGEYDMGYGQPTGQVTAQVNGQVAKPSGEIALGEYTPETDIDTRAQIAAAGTGVAGAAGLAARRLAPQAASGAVQGSLFPSLMMLDPALIRRIMEEMNPRYGQGG